MTTIGKPQGTQNPDGGATAQLQLATNTSL
jgi:hypothetical protein